MVDKAWLIGVLVVLVVLGGAWECLEPEDATRCKLLWVIRAKVFGGRNSHFPCECFLMYSYFMIGLNLFWGLDRTDQRAVGRRKRTVCFPFFLHGASFSDYFER